MSAIEQLSCLPFHVHVEIGRLNNFEVRDLDDIAKDPPFDTTHQIGTSWDVTIIWPVRYTPGVKTNFFWDLGDSYSCEAYLIAAEKQSIEDAAQAVINGYYTIVNNGRIDQ